MSDKPVTLEKPFRDRIVGHGREKVDQLLANPDNWRIHPRPQQSALAGAIDSIGYIRSVTVNVTTGNLVDGHLRVALALRSGVDEIPVEYVELTEDEEKEALLELDPIAALAATDRVKLDELIKHVQSSDNRVQEMLAGLAEQAGLYLDVPVPPPQQEPELPAERFVEIYCSSNDLKSFEDILHGWSKRPGVTINIS